MTKRLTIFIHGESGSGKSWLANNAPGPRLLLDAEGRAEYLKSDPALRTPQKIVEWDPRTPIPAESADPAVLTVVNVQTFTDITLPYQWLAKGEHPFNSVIIDSITEVQQRLIDEVASTSQMQHNQWGEVLRKLEATIRNYRDLRKNKVRPLWAVVVVGGSQDKDGKQRPMLQGQIAIRAPYHFDVVGYLGKRFTAEGGRERYLLIDGFAVGFVAKDNTDDLVFHYGDTIINPNISDMLAVLNTEPQTTTEATASNTGDSTTNG